MPFMEDITKVAKQVAKEAEHVVGKAVKQAGELTDANRHKIDDAIDKAGKFVDSRTDGKFSKQIAQVRGAAGKGVEFVAKQKSADVPPRPGQPREDAEHTGPNAGWADTSVQDHVPHVDGATGQVDDAGHVPGAAAPPVGDTPHPNPIPPYSPPQP